MLQSLCAFPGKMWFGISVRGYGLMFDFFLITNMHTMSVWEKCGWNFCAWYLYSDNGISGDPETFLMHQIPHTVQVVGCYCISPGHT